MANVKAILDNWSGDHALPGELYRDPEVYETEIRRIFMRSWLYVGHQSQVPGRGDYFLFEIAGESVIVIRNAEGGINAMMNVCRHRGSRICDQPTGHESRLVCRYHGWTYGLDGALRAAGHMPQGFDRSQLGLRRLHTRVFMGLIFVSFADEPPSFDAIERRSRRAAPALWSRPCESRSPPELSDHLELEARDRKLLRVLSLRTGAPRVLGRRMDGQSRRSSWKPCWRRSCSAHPRSGSRNTRSASPGSHPATSASTAASTGIRCSAGISRAAATGSLLAPLLGSITGYDGGTTDLHLGPMTFGLAYCDHVVLYRFTPRGLRSTDCEITWLVNESAREGTDYDRAELTWLWDVTTIADKTIIERNQAGVDSRFYVPGPLSPMEDFTRRFLQWYAAIMRETWPPRADRPADERGLPPHGALPVQ